MKISMLLYTVGLILIAASIMFMVLGPETNRTCSVFSFCLVVPTHAQEEPSDLLWARQQAEAVLFAEGFKQLRVRYHDSGARNEVPPEDLPKLMAEDVRNRVVDKIKAQGFSYVSVDLYGYRTGSMNENLEEQE